MAREIVLDIKPKENKLKLYLPWLLGIIGIAAIIFGVGFGVGRFSKVQIPFFEEKTPTKSATKADWYVYQGNGFSLEYPKGWEVKTNPDKDVGGTVVLGDGGEITFWGDSIKAFKFSPEQLKNQKPPKVTSKKIDGRDAQITEYVFKDGNIFIEVKIPEEEKKVKYLFWLNAANTDFKSKLFEILSTFKSTTVSGKISLL